MGIKIATKGTGPDRSPARLNPKKTEETIQGERDHAALRPKLFASHGRGPDEPVTGML
jgi:hypothetical protein